MMRQSTILTVLSVLFLPVLASPMLVDNPLDNRTYTGNGTWFNPGLGTCGQTNTNSDAVVALSVSMYSSGGCCGHWVSVTNTANGKTAYGIVRDKCQTCGSQDLDMSPGLFDQIGDQSTSPLSISWYFMLVE